MANITGTAVGRVEVTEVIEDASDAGVNNNDAESSMGRANRLIREHRKRVEEKAYVAIPAQT